MRRRLHLQRPAGFTLVEVSFSVAIAAIALLALLGLAMVGLRAGRNAASDTAVGTIAQDVFSDLRCQTFAGLDGYNNSDRYYDVTGLPQGSTGYQGDYFRCRILITSWPSAADNYSNYLKRVMLRFTWPQVATPPNTNQYVTVFPKLDP